MIYFLRNFTVQNFGMYIPNLWCLAIFYSPMNQKWTFQKECSIFVGMSILEYHSMAKVGKS